MRLQLPQLLACGVGLLRVLPAVADEEDGLDEALPEEGLGKVDRQPHKLVRISQLLHAPKLAAPVAEDRRRR